MNRRQFLSLSAAAAGGAALTPNLFAQAGRAPARAKDDELKIVDVKIYNTGRLFVRITTSDSSITGWGEYNAGPPAIGEAILNAYKPLLVGVNPTRIEYIWQLLYKAHRNMRGGSALIPAFAAVDIALWDIFGKFTKLPVHAILGGPVRDKLLFYPNAKAFKQTSQIVHNMVERPDHLDTIVADLEKAREKVGKSGYLMYDGHGKLTPTIAIQLCKRIEHLDLLYFEEVVPIENNADLIKVKRATSIPLAAGERMTTIFPFREVLEAKSCDVLNADIVTVGGISQLHKLATLAELYDIPLAPHSTHSLIGLAASLHVDASITNFLIQECYPQKIAFLSADWLPKETQWPADEFMPIPTGPGLGVNVDVDKLEEAAAKYAENPERGVDKAYFRDDGSVGER